MPNQRIHESRRRLAVSILISAFVVSGGLSLLRFSLEIMDPIPASGIFEVTVIEQQDPVEERPAIEPIEEIDEERQTEAIAEIVTEQSPEQDSTVAESQGEEESKETPQWYQVLESVASHSDLLTGHPRSMSAKFDELRRVAVIRYSKPDARFKKPVWENVEKDTMGRTILRAGDCYRVLEDPRVTQIWFQENFGQYLVFCETTGKPPVELAFVQDIQARYDYLQPDTVDF